MSWTRLAAKTMAGVKRGAFIVFEGVDRCGKTTQANMLVKALNEGGNPAVFMRFPGAFRGSPRRLRLCPCYHGSML